MTKTLVQDLIGKQVSLGDTVVYVYQNTKGKTQTKQGSVIGFNNKGVIVKTETETINVKNVILVAKAKQKATKTTKKATKNTKTKNSWFTDLAKMCFVKR